MTFLNLGVFLTFQVFASMLFKWGSTEPGRYWYGFGGGNFFGILSIIMLINLYKVWPAGVVLALATSGAFLLNQIFMFAIYREAMSALSWSGIAMIFSGIVLVSLNH